MSSPVLEKTSSGEDQTIVVMPEVDQDFKHFSTSHSWYKHLGTGKMMALLPMIHLGNRDRNYEADDDQLHWFAHYENEILQSIKDPIIHRIVSANTVKINSLVYGEDIYLVVRTGGNQWFKWLRDTYPDEYRYILKNSKCNRNCWGELEWYTPLRDDDKVVKRLMTSEYNRQLEEFRAAATRIWAALVEAGYTHDTLRKSQLEYAETGWGN
jgi:hypothetical protein